MENIPISSYAQLTPDQRAIVEHGRGPAVTLGVAGSGKTTVLVYRIARLVENAVFQPKRILCAAINNTAATDMLKRLSRHPGCREVQVITLHDLGLSAIRSAYERGYLGALDVIWAQHIHNAKQSILRRTLSIAAERNVAYLSELETLEPADFLGWITFCKNNLHYPDDVELEGDPRLVDLVGEANPPDYALYYLDLFRLYEEVRRELGLITIDDLLLTGWETLHQHEDILRLLNERYDCVVVDEFQDISLVQAEMLDMIARPHRNYMVAGDDDQAIYESQGASTLFLKQFAYRYNARRYPLVQDFRNKAGSLMLADAVIRQNQDRIPKAIRLTQGLAGRLDIKAQRTTREMGAVMVEDVQKRHDAGTPYSSMVILVRTFAQTPPVEQAFIAADVPYTLLGQKPFYKRPAVQTLVDYCRVAHLDKLLADGVRLTPQQSEYLRRCWMQVYPHPNRDLDSRLARSVLETALVQGKPIYQTLIGAGATQAPFLQEQMNELGITLQWLASAFHHGPLSTIPAFDMLRELDERLDYSAYLQRRYGPSETGDDEAELVNQLLAFAQGRGNLSAFLANIQKLDELRSSARDRHEGEAVTIRSIRSAKGLEWPVVFIPSCNPGIIPRHLYGNLEEERRLLYLALTRPRDHLYIYYQQPEPSPFLAEADYQKVLSDLAAIRTAAAKYPVAWTENDVSAMAVTAVQRGLWTYFRDWAPWPEQIQRQAGLRVTKFYEEQNLGSSSRAIGLSSPAVEFWYGAAKGVYNEDSRVEGHTPGWLHRLTR